MAAGDLDGDGDVDAVASFAAGGRIAWYENLGGDFGDPALNERLISNLADPSSVAIADLDGDGDLDVVSTSSSGSVTR